MGRLAGFRYRDVARKFGALGFALYRQAAGSHEIWKNAATGHVTTIPNPSGDMPEGTVRAIVRAAGVTPDEFLNA